MKEKIGGERVISLLALERCETCVAHICALVHTAPEGCDKKEHQKHIENILHIMQNISRDISLVKDTIE